jgi:hypothetical protein
MQFIPPDIQPRGDIQPAQLVNYIHGNIIILAKNIQKTLRSDFH